MKDRRNHLQRLQSTSVQSLSATDSQRTLSILDFSYVHDGARLERFERKHNAVVEVETVTSSAEAIRRLNSDPVPDLAALGNYAVPKAISEDLLKPISIGQITGYESIFDQLKRGYFERRADVYAVPRSFGQTPLCYRTDRVSSPVTTWRALWRGDIADPMFRDDAQLALAYATMDPKLPVTDISDGVETETLRQTFIEMLQEISQLWRTADDSQLLFRRLSPVDAGPMWRFAAEKLRRMGEPIQIVRPEAGLKAWFIQFVRPAKSGADSLAREFIEAWFDSLGWDSLMQPRGIAIPSRKVFERYGANIEAYGLNEFEQFIEQPPLQQGTVRRCQQAWAHAKQVTGLDDE
ncbi:MAG: PotD/PotF family extracellular solute-binding protein [Haloarcula sp.]